MSSDHTPPSVIRALQDRLLHTRSADAIDDIAAEAGEIGGDALRQVFHVRDEEGKTPLMLAAQSYLPQGAAVMPRSEQRVFRILCEVESRIITSMGMGLMDVEYEVPVDNKGLNHFNYAMKRQSDLKLYDKEGADSIIEDMQREFADGQIPDRVLASMSMDEDQYSLGSCSDDGIWEDDNIRKARARGVRELAESLRHGGMELDDGGDVKGKKVSVSIPLVPGGVGVIGGKVKVGTGKGGEKDTKGTPEARKVEDSDDDSLPPPPSSGGRGRS